MAIENLLPKAAHEAMSRDPGRVFIDVRTPMEYTQGHPAGAVNVPWTVIDPRSGAPGPNPNFIADVKKLAAPDTHLYVSCQAGGRSIGACRDLLAAGFLNLINVDGGFGGRPGTPGWRDSGLPVER